MDSQTQLTPEQKKEEAEKQLRMDYHKVFESEAGKNVLLDLKKRFGWQPNGIEKPSYTPGNPVDQLIFNEAIKTPLRYILNTLTEPVDVKPKPEKAQTHE